MNGASPSDYAVCASSAIAEREGVLVSAAGLEIGIFRVGGRLVAYENRCRHQGGPVCSGRVLGRLEAVLGPGGTIVEERFSDSELHLVCPWHGWEYDLATGECSVDRALKLRSFAVTERDGHVYLSLTV